MPRRAARFFRFSLSLSLSLSLLLFPSLRPLPTFLPLFSLPHLILPTHLFVCNHVLLEDSAACAGMFGFPFLSTTSLFNPQSKTSSPSPN